MYELHEVFQKPLEYVGQAKFDLQVPPTLIPEGSLPSKEVPRLPSETSIRPSIFAEYMKKRGFTPKTIPARLGPGFDKDGVFRSPAQEGLNKYPPRSSVSPLSQEDHDLLIECAHAVSRMIPSRVLLPLLLFRFLKQSMEEEV
jgi:hypothetical protein